MLMLSGGPIRQGRDLVSESSVQVLDQFFKGLGDRRASALRAPAGHLR